MVTTNYQKRKEYFRLYQKINKERIARVKHDSYIRNRETLLEKQKHYRQINKENIRAIYRRWRYKKFNGFHIKECETCLFFTFCLKLYSEMGNPRAIKFLKENPEWKLM